jgi:UDP-glucose 4-epimerase
LSADKDGAILITGGAGYIGSHANKALSKGGHATLVLDNFHYGHEEFLKWGDSVRGDLSDIDFIRKVFKEHPIKAVMHFAAYTYVGESVKEPQKYYLNNLRNTLNLLEVMLENDVRNFIFSSTCAVYGEPSTVPITEDEEFGPVSPYGRSKAAVEHVLEDYGRAYDMRYVSLRYFNAAGADPDCEVGEWHDPETHLIPLVLDVALGRREQVEIFGTDYKTPDGTCLRDYIHVTDLAAAHALALDHLLAGGRSEVFNLGNGTGFSVKEVIGKAREVTGVDIKAVEGERRPGDPPVLVAGNEKITRGLGWKPEHSDLGRIIETAWAWHQKMYSEYRK